MAIRRQVLDVAGVPHHRAPIPQAVKIGNMVFSSAVGGQEADGSTPSDPARQAELAFANVRAILEAAGGTPDNIAKMTVYLKDMRHREAVNVEWLKMFPDEHDRPARHAVLADVAGSMVLQLEFIAVL